MQCVQCGFLRNLEVSVLFHTRHPFQTSRVKILSVQSMPGCHNTGLLEHDRVDVLQLDIPVSP